MSEHVAQRVVELIEHSPAIDVVDLTGGAPELNPHFRHLVSAARRLGRQVIDRCNLTVLFEDQQRDLAEFLASNGVHVIASLPCYEASNVDGQRGKGVFGKSIDALRYLNRLGYSQAGSGLRLDLVFNPLGPRLPPHQSSLEARYREELARTHGVSFDSLFTLANMPIQRFARTLEREQAFVPYMSLLVNHFNPATVSALMCRTLVSVAWDGQLYDCDFNQMLGLPLGAGIRTVWDLRSFDELTEHSIRTAEHCFGCTAGAGSSCGGALD
jgi:radical SAM/Cys-rich protein